MKKRRNTLIRELAKDKTGSLQNYKPDKGKLKMSLMIKEMQINATQIPFLEDQIGKDYKEW